MRTSVAALSALSGLTLALISVAHAVPLPDPVYTFCETEDNDLCSNPQILDANLAAESGGGGAEGEFVRDCFYLTGKLQKDCVWDIEPKCAMKVYDKPAPCRTTSGGIIQGSFYEPVIRSSNGEDLTNVIPLSDRTIRLGVAALQDAFDGTINGLANNGPHGETGEVTIKIFYNGGGDGQPRGEPADQTYVFRFGGHPNDSLFHELLCEALDGMDNVRGTEPELIDECCDAAVGSDALRVAFIIPSNVPSVDIVCCNNTGTQAVCYDVDHYEVTHLLPGKFYNIEVIGGTADKTSMGLNGLLTELVNCLLGCEFPTNTKLGWFDKNCNLLAFDDNIIEIPDLLTALGTPSTRGFAIDFTDFVYSKLYATSEEDGTLRFAVSGGGYAFPAIIGQIVQSPIPPTGSGGSGVPANDTLTSSVTIPSNFLTDRFKVDGVVVSGLNALAHPNVTELTAKLRHESTGKTVTLFDQPPSMSANFNPANLYFFADGPVPFVATLPTSLPAAAVLAGSNGDIPSGLYFPKTPLSAFAGDELTGTWTLEITDHTIENTGFLGAWEIIIVVSDHGDCDFNGLDDNIQARYFDLLDRLRIVDGLDFVYRQGASTKDSSVDDVIRYPRSIWDPSSNQNPHGEGFLANYGGAPEAFFAHGVCGGYCIKIQLAEHIDPADRPAVPTVMNSARADINSDGIVNASDLALLLSYWGIVQ